MGRYVLAQLAAPPLSLGTSVGARSRRRTKSKTATVNIPSIIMLHPNPPRGLTRLRPRCAASLGARARQFLSCLEPGDHQVMRVLSIARNSIRTIGQS